ncbi:uncharacterized protein LOC135366345 [Ornithodoros turicata]|uniref:uncharacterized protein LOC135366345 n=1 Tax=Ornithodoros turicata TaxID=34597 RepID=UPI003138EF90
MGCLTQIRIMLWKNIWIQTILRHPYLTAVEIVFALLFTIALLNAAYWPGTGGASYAPAKVHPPVVPPVLAKSRLVYGPSSPYAVFVVSNAFPDLEDPTQIPPDPKKSRPFVECGEMSEVQQNCQMNDYCVFLHSDGSNTIDLNYSVVVHVEKTEDLDVFRQSYVEQVSPALPMIVSLQARIERAHLKWVERNVAPSALSDQRVSPSKDEVTDAVGEVPSSSVVLASLVPPCDVQILPSVRAATSSQLRRCSANLDQGGQVLPSRKPREFSTGKGASRQKFRDAGMKPVDLFTVVRVAKASSGSPVADASSARKIPITVVLTTESNQHHFQVPINTFGNVSLKVIQGGLLVLNA